MAKKFMTIQEAANHLDVCEKTVRNYLSRGYLGGTRQVGSNRIWLAPEEVESFRREKSESRTRSIVSREEMMKVNSRLRRLESRVETLLHVVDAKHEALGISASYAKTLHAACVEQLQITGWASSLMDPWIHIFMHIDEEDFQTMSEAVADSRPWLPFLRLCTSMSVYVAQHTDYVTSLELQAQHKLLTESRRRLRVSMLCHAELYGTVSDPQVRRMLSLGVPNTLLDSVERRIRGLKT